MLHVIYKRPMFIQIVKVNFAGSLKEHVESIHEGVRYPCDQCDYKATQKGSLKRHKKSNHL